MLTLNIFHTFFLRFYCCLWVGKCLLVLRLLKITMKWNQKCLDSKYFKFFNKNALIISKSVNWLTNEGKFNTKWVNLLTFKTMPEVSIHQWHFQLFMALIYKNTSQLTPETYSESCKKSFFRKKLHLRCLTRLWMRLLRSPTSHIKWYTV